MRRKALGNPMGRASSELPNQTSTIINAAALQDHLMRSINLKVPPPRRPLHSEHGRFQSLQPNPTLCPRQSGLRDRSRMLADETGLRHEQMAVTGVVASQVHEEYRRVWICETCTFENEQHVGWNTHDERRCGSCGALRPSKPRRQSITLAQQRGLVPPPQPKLSKDEWERCESQAIERGDVDHPCSICRESFGVQKQVILSCSHIFHLACIQSFERFMRTNQRVCPLCRKENYRKRMTSKAAGYQRESYAVRIQAVYRGYFTRRRVKDLWHQFYRSGYGDPMRRRAFLANRVGKTTDQLVVALRAKDDSIDSLLAEFDRTILLSKQIFDDAQPQTDDSFASKCLGQREWRSIYLKAATREDRECPICIQSFSTTMKDAVLLTCSHVFHRECLVAFEDFNIYEVPLCPLCRSGYQSRAWSDVKIFLE